MLYYFIYLMLDYKHDCIMLLWDCMLDIIDCNRRNNGTLDCNVNDKTQHMHIKSANLIKSAQFWEAWYKIWDIGYVVLCLIGKIWLIYLIKCKKICLKVSRGFCPSRRNRGASVLRGFCPSGLLSAHPKGKWDTGKKSLAIIRFLCVLKYGIRLSFSL